MKQVFMLKGYLVAFEAKAELLDKRALTSMMKYSSEVGLSAYWMLHSPMIPKWFITFMDVRLSMWYSSFDSV